MSVIDGPGGNRPHIDGAAVAAWQVTVTVIMSVTDGQVAAAEQLLRSWNWNLTFARSPVPDRFVVTVNIERGYSIEVGSDWAEFADHVVEELLTALRDVEKRPVVVGLEIMRSTRSA
jgi:hypothetical protein